VAAVVAYEFPVGSLGFPWFGKQIVAIPERWSETNFRVQVGRVFHRWLRRDIYGRLGGPGPESIATFEDYTGFYILDEKPDRDCWEVCRDLIEINRFPNIEIGAIPDGCFFEFGNFQASPDLVIDSTLIEVKVTAAMGITQEMSNQLMTYLCVLRENDIFIDKIGLYSAFHGRVTSRPVLKRWEKRLDRLTDWLIDQSFSENG
jgi:hypothetical protein